MRVLLTGVNLPFPGQHRADDDICRLTARLDYRWAPQLDLLIERCTSNDPSMRPRMREVAAELDAMIRPTMEAAAMEDTADLERRITVMTERHRRRDQDRAGFNDRVARAWQPVEVAVPRSLLRLPSVYPGEAWGGMIVVPGSAGARVDLGVFLHLHDQAGRCTVAAIVAVNRHHQGRGLTVSVLDQVFQTTVGTAHFDTILAEVWNALAGCVPKALTELEEALEAEQQLAAQIEHANR